MKKEKEPAVELVCEVLPMGDGGKLEYHKKGLLQRSAKKSTEIAFREWLQRHGKPGSTYQVLILKGERLTVQEEKVKTFTSESKEEGAKPKAVVEAGS